jgi:hypothetical protein
MLQKAEFPLSDDVMHQPNLSAPMEWRNATGDRPRRRGCQRHYGDVSDDEI